jgi:outer membrane protein assembly factor BamB
VVGVLVAVVVAAQPGSGACAGNRNKCTTYGIVRWSQLLAGSWVAQNDVEGTIYSQGQATAAAGNGVALIGFGLTISAYDVTTGFPRWTETLGGLPPGSAIVSVLAWRDVVTVGVTSPGSGSGQVIVLSSVTGKQIRTFRCG